MNSQKKSHIKVRGKGNREREIGVSPQVAKLVWKYSRLYRHSKQPDEQRIFVVRYGEPLSKRGIEAIVTRVRFASGITDVQCPPHTFRRTFSTMCLVQGGAIEKLSRELGHSTVHVTEEYIKSLPLSVARQDHEEFSPVRRLRLTSRRRAAYGDAC